MTSDEFFAAARAELDASLEKWGESAGVHEAYSVLLEEVEEYRDWVRQKNATRDGHAMVRELIQIAAMAAKAARIPQNRR